MSTQLDEHTVQQLTHIANTIRSLSIDGVLKANSGHPGLPLGCAELGAYLYTNALEHYPKKSNWINRDRFILSAGHGSMWLYACLHLSGFNLSLEQLKNFRQLGSQTPGHPESFLTDGVETTTGPLGQGIGNGIGQALGLKRLANLYNTDDYTLFNSKVYVLAGDGCIMEGVSAETSSLAGHLSLDNLIVIYDSNDISLDGPLSECCSEDTAMRYKSYGWDVITVNGHDFQEIHSAISSLKEKQDKPTLIIAKTKIGKGSPKEDSHKVHGSPLNSDEVNTTKKKLGIAQTPFDIPPGVSSFFESLLKKQNQQYELWIEKFNQWKNTKPLLYKQYKSHSPETIDLHSVEKKLKDIEIPDSMATRSYSNTIIQTLSEIIPSLIVGSADLSCSDMAFIKETPFITAKDFTPRNIKYGVREFGMATMATGLEQTGIHIPVIGTFLTFSDYMRNAIRLASLMKTKVIYQFTHDSVFLGEDGPTHQPVEHIASLRAIPNLQVIRPGSAHETKMAWLAALDYEGPTAIILSRQKFSEVNSTHKDFQESLALGAYVLEETDNPDFTIYATGSEVALASNVQQELIKRGKNVRLISVPCFERFFQQPIDYQNNIIRNDNSIKVSMEAGISMPWYRFIGKDGLALAIDTFGESAPAKEIAHEHGFTVESILATLLG